MTMCVNFVKIRLVVFDFYAKGHSHSVSQSLAKRNNNMDTMLRYPYEVQEDVQKYTLLKNAKPFLIVSPH